MESLVRMAQEVLDLERVWYHKMKAEKFHELPPDLPKDRRKWRSYTLFTVMTTYHSECQITGITYDDLKLYLKENGARMTRERKAKEATMVKLNLSLFDTEEKKMARKKKETVPTEEVVQAVEEVPTESIETPIPTPALDKAMPTCKLKRMFETLFNDNLQLKMHGDIRKSATDPYKGLTKEEKAKKIADNNGKETCGRAWVKSLVGDVEALLIEHDVNRAGFYSMLVRSKGFKIANLCVKDKWKDVIVLQVPNDDNVYYMDKVHFNKTWYKEYIKSLKSTTPETTENKTQLNYQDNEEKVFGGTWTAS